MKKFELLGKSLTQTAMRSVKGGNVNELEGKTCYATCENGVTWGLNCTSGYCFASQDTIGAIACGGQLYAYGCPATVKL
ncbi:MAG: hypothetical protein ACOVRK_14740 [Chryseobacterium taeanense]